MARRPGRILSAVGLLALTALTACTPAEDCCAAPVRSVASPPAGMRWQGADDVVVAVPEEWTTLTDPCQTTREPAVRIDGPVDRPVPCPLPRSRPSGLVVAPDDLGALPAPDTLRHRTEVDGMTVRHGGVRCSAGANGPCTLTFTVPTVHLTFEVGYLGPHPRRFVERMMRSLTALPAGSTTVPVVPLGTSDDDAVALLEEAGLVGEAPDVDFPHYVTGTRPAAGLVVPARSSIELEVGDG
ncbi:PASTA domain-containing protein [Nocardioides conyzicola]|uniref:PASTA domain-containing protein n=1 Tax=Nocardioides conyzicola TaxID=1651781 RepID=A0ABP8XX58_9ACTN